MTSRLAALLLAVLAAMTAAAPADAQIVRDDGARTRLPVSAPEASISPLDLGGRLENVPFKVQLTAVSVSSPTSVLLSRHLQSLVRLHDPQTRANGTYAVVFTFPWVNQPAQVRIISGQSSVLATCSLTQDLNYQSVEQHCEASQVVSDGQVDVRLEIVSGVQMELGRITVRRTS